MLRDGRKIDPQAEDDEFEGEEEDEEEEEEEEDDEEDAYNEVDGVGEDDSEDDDPVEEDWKPPSTKPTSNQPPRFLNQPSSSSKDSPAKDEDLLNDLVLGEEDPRATPISDKLKSEEVDILRKSENVQGS